jgi:hypothetical protein
MEMAFCIVFCAKGKDYDHCITCFENMEKDFDEKNVALRKVNHLNLN